MQRQDAANAHSGEYSTPAEQSHSMSTIAHYMAQPSGKHLLTTKTGKIRIRSTRPIQHKAERGTFANPLCSLHLIRLIFLAAGGKTYHTYGRSLLIFQLEPVHLFYSGRFTGPLLPAVCIGLAGFESYLSSYFIPSYSCFPVTSRAVYFKPDTLGYGNRTGSPTIYGQSLTDPCSAGHQAHGEHFSTPFLSRSTQGINDRPFFVISYEL